MRWWGRSALFCTATCIALSILIRPPTKRVLAVALDNHKARLATLAASSLCPDMVVVEATASAFGSRDILHGTQACADILAVIVGSVPVGLRLRWCVAIRADARTAQVCSIELEAGGGEGFAALVRNHRHCENRWRRRRRGWRRRRHRRRRAGRGRLRQAYLGEGWAALCKWKGRVAA